MDDNNGHTNRRAYIKAVSAATGATITGMAGCTTFSDESDSEGITIGATIPRTGQFSSLGQDLERGYKIGVERMNQNGGVNGQQVNLVLKDDESDAQTLRQQLQQITSNNDVDMLWGSFSSLLVTAGSAYAEQQGIPFLGVAFAYMQPHVDDEYEWTFSPMPKSRDVAASTKGMLELIPEGERPQRVGIWEPNSGWGKEQSDEWDQKLSNAGYDVVLREKFSLGNQDFSTLISRSKSANVEILLSVPTPPGGITAVKQMKENNFVPEVLQFVRGADPEAWWSALGDSGAYAMMCPGWVPGRAGNGHDGMLSLYDAEYGLPEDKILPVMVGTTYNLTQVAEQAIKSAGSTEAKELQSALNSETFDTVLGTFPFDQYGMPAEGELNAPVGQWWEGSQRMVYPEGGSDVAMDLKYPLQF